MGREQVERISRALGGCQRLLRDLDRGREVALDVIGMPPAGKHSRLLRRLSDPGRQHARAREGPPRSPGATIPWTAASGAPIVIRSASSSLIALARLRQRPDQVDGAPQMADGLLVRRSLRRPRPGPLVVRDRLRDQPRLIAMPGDHLGLGRDAFGEAFLQHLATRA